MFNMTEREDAVYDLLIAKYPNIHPQLAQLIAWCGIHRPERLQEILEQHKSDTDADMIDLETFDMKSIIKKPVEIEDANE
jgi:hypothetical protein